MYSSKTNRFLTAIALATLVANTAFAHNKGGFCNIGIQPDLRSYTSPVSVARIDGRFDSTARRWWWDIAVAPTCVIFGACVMYYTAPNPDIQYRSPDDWTTAEKEYVALKHKCTQYLRKNFSSDILFDDGASTVIAEHYFCSEPGINGKPGQVIPDRNDGDGNQYSIWVMHGEPVFGPTKTPEEIHGLKCEKLKACYARAHTEAQMAQVSNLNQTLGCF